MADTEKESANVANSETYEENNVVNRASVFAVIAVIRVNDNYIVIDRAANSRASNRQQKNR